MSNFGSLNLKISKAMATTSTTNTNSTSLPTNTSYKVSSKGNATALSRESSMSFLKSNNSSPESTSSMGDAMKACGSGDISVSPTKITSSNGSKDKVDLINIFEKFSLEPVKDSVEIDSIEEKFEQIKTTGRPSKNEAVTTENEDEITNDEAENADDASSCSSKQGSSEIIENETAVFDTHTGKDSSVSELFQSRIENTANQPKPEFTHEELVESDSKNLGIEGSAMGIQPYIIDDTTLDREEIITDVPEANAHGDKESDKIDERHCSPAEESNDFLNIDGNEPIEEMQIEFSGTPEPEVQDGNHSNQRPDVVRKDSIAKANLGIVNASEQHQQSHRPFDFQVFLSHLKKKSADPIVRYIRSFLMSFARQASSMHVSQMAKAIRNFKLFIEKKFKEYEPFASMNENGLENSIEGVEKLIMNRLYDFCFPPEVRKKLITGPPSSMSRDLSDDDNFADQTEKFSWVSGVHLDVDLYTLSEKRRRTSGDDIDYIEYAADELNKINRYRAPRDKMICILNACKILFSLLRVTSQETNADAFIPLLILVILKAKTEHIISNIHYIENFRGEKWLNHGETSYYLSTIQAAIKFIQNIQKEDLTIDEAHFDAHMEAWDAELRQRAHLIKQTEDVTSTARPVTTPVKRGVPPSSVLKSSAEMITKSLSSLILPSEQASSEQSQVSEQDYTRSTLEADVNEVFTQLSEVFPSLDKDIMRDIIISNNADFETSLDMCLQLLQEA